MSNERIFNMSFPLIYKMYVDKSEKKGQTKAEVNTIIIWLTGYDQKQLDSILDTEIDLETFFKNAPEINKNTEKITGSICGVKIQEIEEPLMKNIRYIDKLIDELAKGKAMEKLLRS